MSKKNGPMPNNDRGRIRVFAIELDADNETLRETVRSAISVFSRNLPPVRNGTAPALADGTQDRKKKGELPTSSSEDAAESSDFMDDDGVTDEADESTSPQKGNTLNSDKPKRKAPTYQFVKDLDLRPEGKQSLRDFFLEKKPNDQQKQLTVILYYLTDILGMSNVSPNHIYHGFNDVGKKSPLDIASSSRLTSKRKGWIDTSDGDNLRMTTKGQNFIKHDLPENAAAQA